jgi:glycosyltransferase involved in cell wall biosynthesis
MPEAKRIAVCTLTYRRNEGLEHLLEALASQEFSQRPADVRVVVIDNNPDGSAASVCERWRGRLGDGLSYVHVEQPGIAVARNAALAAAEPAADWIAFIDDDSVPERDCLDRLLEVADTHDADVVTGPLKPDFEVTPPDWVRAGNFFARPRRPTGARLDTAFTNNVMFRSSIVRDLNIRFDERLNLTGGEDRHFFCAVNRAGYSIVWADDALTTHHIPKERLNKRWLIRRKFRSGHTDAYVDLEVAPGFLTMSRLLGKGAAWLAAGLLLYPVGFVIGEHWRVRAVRGMAYGLGTIRGSLGKEFVEYPRP